jgi:histidine ammonia-lyase
MLIAAGASASGLSATKLANENAPTQDLLQWRQLLHGASSSCAEAVFHLFRLYNRKISRTQPVMPTTGNVGGREDDLIH